MNVHFQCIKLLVEKGADGVNTKDNKGKTPLFAAAERGSYQSIEKLVELGADVNIRDNENCPPLFVLRKNRFHDCLKLIIQSGADVNFYEDRRNRTALMDATFYKEQKYSHTLRFRS